MTDMVMKRRHIYCFQSTKIQNLLLSILCIFSASLIWSVNVFANEETPFGLTSQTNSCEDSESPNPAQSIGLYGEIDIGVPLLLFPHNNLFEKYKDSDANLGFRIAASATYWRFRFELGYLTRHLNKGERNITSYNGFDISESTSQAELEQREVLLFWLRNDPHRVSFIGGGPIRVKVHERFSLETTGGSTLTVSQTTTANGWKFVVGGKDTDSRLKTHFSYTWAKVNPELGTNYYVGGYSFGWSLSFGGP